jgi:hypothetical protein
MVDLQFGGAAGRVAPIGWWPAEIVTGRCDEQVNATGPLTVGPASAGGREMRPGAVARAIRAIWHVITPHRSM